MIARQEGGEVPHIAHYNTDGHTVEHTPISRTLTVKQVTVTVDATTSNHVRLHVETLVTNTHTPHKQQSNPESSRSFPPSTQRYYCITTLMSNNIPQLCLITRSLSSIPPPYCSSVIFIPPYSNKTNQQTNKLISSHRGRRVSLLQYSPRQPQPDLFYLRSFV